MKRSAIPLLALLMLVGCSADPEVISDKTTVTATVTAAPTASASPSTAATQMPAAPPVAPAPTATDVTPQVRAASPDLESYVKAATSTEAGRVTVETFLVDPRGDAGSDEALLALQLCNDIVANFAGTTNVSIMEDDGSTWVLYGHPSYGDTCTEV
jgi:hypothetical protein